MSGYIDAGSLDERLERLELHETAANTWEWVPMGRLWAQVTVDGGTNLFSRVGIGARNAKLTIRSRDITLYGALRWRGQHLFLTSITKLDRMYLDVQTALVDPAVCRANTDEEEPGVAFPGILTEKYAKWEQPEPYSINRLTYVLVAPKVIQLQRGGLVEVDGVNYEVQVAHTLDPYKNEYEIVRTEDL